MKSDRLLPRNTDVRPYVVDGVIHLAELNHHIHRHYYYAGIYGDDVPEWQVRGESPRSMETVENVSCFDESHGSGNVGNGY